MPDQLKKSKLKMGETIVLFSHKLMALKWMDKKEVNVFLLPDGHSHIQLICPTKNVTRKNPVSISS
jgi:hypothetical protein